MGWTWRRSTSLGPLRLNFSKSGVGMSVGVRGARISTGPRGTYVHVGAGGFRYSRRIDGSPRANRPASPVVPPPLPTSAPGGTVEVLEPAHLVDSNADELLEEIRRKAERPRLVPFLAGTSVIGLVGFLILLDSPTAALVRWSALVAGVLGLVGLPLAVWSDRRAGLVHIHYVLDPLGNRVQEGLEGMIQAFQRTHQVWAVNEEHHHGDWKRNAGAGTSVGRRRVGVGFGAPPFVRTNARVGFLNIDGTRLYFFPDRLLILGRGGARTVAYTDLSIRAGTVRFVEEGAVPRDARVLGKTWRYVNKDGGPDRRFRENRQIPVVLYGTLEIAAPCGLRLNLQTSTEGLASGTEKLLLVTQDAIRELRSRRAPPPQLEPLPDFDEDPPPLLLPGYKALGTFVDLVTFRWLTVLPEWARLAVWGVLFSLLPVALITWLARGGVPSLIFLGAALVLTGLGISGLVHGRLGRNRETRLEDTSPRVSQPPPLPANGSSGRPTPDVDITDRPRSGPRAPEIAPAGTRGIHAETKAPPTPPPVSDIIGDDREDDTQWLDQLQAQLGISEPARVAPKPGPTPLIPADRAVRTSESPPPRSVTRTGQAPPLDRGAGLRSSDSQPREIAQERNADRSAAVPRRAVPGQVTPARIRSIRPVRAPEVPPSPPVARTAEPIPLATPDRKTPADVVPVRPARPPEPLPPLPVAEIGRTPPGETGAGLLFLESRTREVNREEPATMRWHGKGGMVRVRSFLLNEPLVYLSRGRPRDDEASCIDLSLPIGQHVIEPRGSLGYYPHYASISPDQRANYLRWLAGGRMAPLDDIGYAFLFFYGLERRLLVEQQDLSPIVKEVVRLLESYTFSGSFDGYLSRFLSYTLARAGIGTLKDKWFEAVFDRTRAQRDEQHLAVGLAWLFSRGLPLPVNWALRIARLDPRAPRSVVLDRLPGRFRELFAKRYRERFGDGMALKVSKRDREVTYRPASPSLLDLTRVSDAIRPVRIPHVMGIQSQFKPLIEIWTGCIEDLKPLSRALGRGAEVLTRDAYEALPDELKPGVEHPDKSAWDRLAAENAREDGSVLVTVGHLATIHGLPRRSKLTARQSESIARTAHHVGLEIEPDARVTNRPYGWDEVVALLRPEESPRLPGDSRYAGAALMLEMGLFVASADGEVGDDEVDHITRFLESQFLLDPPDARRLEALKRVLMDRTPSLAGVGKRLQAVLTAGQREAVGRFLVGIAAANGTIDRKEVAALRSAYKALDVDVGLLNQLLDEFHRATKEPVEVHRPMTPSRPGEVIPPRPKGPSPIQLDENLLRRILGETHEVARMLGEAMRERDPESGELADDAPRTPTPTPPSPPPTAPRFEGLDPRFHAVLTELLIRPTWSRQDFDALVRRHRLMPAGAVDTINEWAEDQLGDLIIEDDGDDLTIHTNLVREPS